MNGKDFASMVYERNKLSKVGKSIVSYPVIKKIVHKEIAIATSKVLRFHKGGMMIREV